MLNNLFYWIIIIAIIHRICLTIPWCYQSAGSIKYTRSCWVGIHFFIHYVHFIIIYMIRTFSPRALAVITTTRKYFTVLFSIFIYDHPVQEIQWLSIVIVAIGLAWELYMVYWINWIICKGYSKQEKAKKKSDWNNNVFF